LVLEALIMFGVLGFPIGVLLICICKDPKITRGICLGWEFYICKKWCFFVMDLKFHYKESAY
jgi:hypothetical protein